MKTPEEILDEIAAENMVNIKQMVTTRQLVVLAMRRYAKLYHESEVKKLTIPAVVGQSELLFAFIKAIKEEFADQNWDYLDFIAERFLGKQ